MVELIEEIPATTPVLIPVNITQNNSDDFFQTTTSFLSIQQFQAPLSHILEVVLGYDTNHFFNKILLDNAVTTLTGFMFLDEDTIKLLDTTYNGEKLRFPISHQQNLLVAVEWVNSIIRKNP